MKDEEIDLRPGDLVKVKGFHGYGKIVSMDTLGEENYKVEIFFPEKKETHTIVYPLTEIEKIFTPMEMLKAYKIEQGWKFNLRMDAMRFSLAHQYDPYFSLSVNRIDVLPHQIEGVYKIIASYDQRFLLADDTGLGKTITAGMILTELKARGRANRVLIVVPAPLQELWQGELFEKFDEQYQVYNSSFVRNLSTSIHPSENVWEKYNKIVTSVDYVKREDVRVRLERTLWDMIVFDEAHHLSAYKYGNDIKRTARYRLAESLKDNTDGLLFLTATPHKGDSFAFYAVLSLLNPYLFVDEFNIDKDKLKRIMIRRLKEEAKGFDGKPLFLPRDVQTLPVSFSASEQQLYEQVTEYVRKWYNIAKERGNRNVGFAMVILQKRMVSSIAAIRQSLKNRKGRLENLLEMGEKATELTPEEERLLKRYFEDPEALDDPDSFTDEEKECIEKNVEVITAARNAEELKMEIRKLEELINLSESVQVDSKSNKLVEFVEGILRKDPKEKVLIFTEYRDTLEYLKDIFEKKGHDLAIIHGGIDYQKRKEQQNKFRMPETNLMLATDAAREGINLQFAHIMIDYELPWNPNRVEQRMGRLHRYGQKKRVQIFNLLVSNTREGEIFEKLMDKLELIREEMGERVFDVLGILLSNVRVQDLIMEALRKRNVKEAYKVIDKNVSENKQVLLEEIEEKSLIKDRLNLAPLIDKQEISKEKSITEEDVKRFTRFFFTEFGGKMKKAGNGIYSLNVPNIIVDNNVVKTSYDKVTFSRDIATELGRYDVEFAAVGCPMIDRIIHLCKEPTFGGRIAVKLDPSNRDGVVFNYHMKSMDGTGRMVNEQLYTFFVDAGERNITEVNPKIIWDFEDVPNILDEKIMENVSNMVDTVEEMQKETERKAVRKAEELLNKAKNQRFHEVSIKRKYAKEYFDKRIEKSKKRIKEYKRRAFLKDMTIAIRGEEAKVKKYEEELKDFEEKLRREENVLSEVPDLLSIAIILPKKGKVGKPQRVDEKAKIKVEMDGMRVAMNYEKSKGRIPEDVSKECRGYDIKSVSKEETRYIEVKAFAESGVVEMTENEWIMATKLKDEYWLYVVEYATTESKRKLNLIQNLSGKIPSPELIPTQVMIKIENWQKSVDEIVTKQ